MKICLTHVKTFKKAPKYTVRKDFIKRLVKSGMPQEFADELMHSNRVTWQKEDVDSSTIYAAEIIDDEAPLYESEVDD